MAEIRARPAHEGVRRRRSGGRRLELRLPHGSFIALLGPSGCGKTTTMNMISGLEKPTAARSASTGTAITKLPPGHRNVGFVFQNYAIFTHMTVVREPRVRAAGRKPRKRPQGRGRSRGAGGRRGRRACRRRSTARRARLIGERHAEGRARAQHDRRARDLPARRAVLEPRRRVPRLHARRAQADPAEIGQTMVYVTHDQVEAMSMADRIAVMDRGRAAAVRHARRPLQPARRTGSSPASSARC